MRGCLHRWQSFEVRIRWLNRTSSDLSLGREGRRVLCPTLTSSVLARSWMLHQIFSCRFDASRSVFRVTQLFCPRDVWQLDRIRNLWNPIDDSGDVDPALTYIKAFVAAGMDQSFFRRRDFGRRIA